MAMISLSLFLSLILSLSLSPTEYPFLSAGDRHMHNFVSEGFCQHDISVITLGYRLAYSGSGLDHCVEDVVTGLQQVQKSFPASDLLLAGEQQEAKLHKILYILKFTEP